MAKKSEATEPEPDDRGHQSAIEERRKAREEATTQEGVEPPENQDINEPPA